MEVWIAIHPNIKKVGMYDILCFSKKPELGTYGWRTGGLFITFISPDVLKKALPKGAYKETVNKLKREPMKIKAFFSAFKVEPIQEEGGNDGND